jgi:hypothetical protein
MYAQKQSIELLAKDQIGNRVGKFCQESGDMIVGFTALNRK